MVLCTSAFETYAMIQCESLGHPNLPKVVVPHPIGGDTAEAAREKANDSWERVMSWLMGVIESHPESGPSGP